MMLICAPVMALKSGARRCSGSAICGPVKVMMLTSTPSNSPAACAVPATSASAATPASGARTAFLHSVLMFIGYSPGGATLTRLRETVPAPSQRAESGWRHVRTASPFVQRDRASRGLAGAPGRGRIRPPHHSAAGARSTRADLPHGQGQGRAPAPRPPAPRRRVPQGPLSRGVAGHRRHPPNSTPHRPSRRRARARDFLSLCLCCVDLLC